MGRLQFQGVGRRNRSKREHAAVAQALRSAASAAQAAIDLSGVCEEMRQRMKKRWLLRIPGILLIVIAAVAIFGAAVEHLWNWLVPAIIGWHAINFWQAVGILLLGKIFFGCFRGRGGVHLRARHGGR